MKKDKWVFSVNKILFFILLVIFIGVLQAFYFNNNYNSSLIKFLTIRQKESDSLINTIWQVQAGVTTLTIAILALIVGLNKEKRYGIKVLQYILITKPKFLKYHDEIILSIILLFISYFFVAYGALPSVVFLFFVSTVLIIDMVYTSIKVVLFDEKVDLELKDYILYQCRLGIEEENRQFKKEGK
ncbi:hypothetical protein COC52_24895 [Priestia megaterium]|uniref:hypothetical protein n=1 Tax=Priestia megaterium TaxID=1404 RepID=UPI000BFE13DC|nr:hypothetical protein [Priestia megaterium]PGR23034.1 hypothetical protein COC52_24895 [Priestia megaterium]